MKTAEDNIIMKKSKIFALRITKLYKYLSAEYREYVLSKQLLRSGTSIGANVYEATFAQTKAEFASKMTIALKEAKESQYWIELLTESDYLSEKEGKNILEDCQEIIYILLAICKTSYGEIGKRASQI